MYHEEVVQDLEADLGDVPVRVLEAPHDRVHHQLLVHRVDVQDRLQERPWDMKGEQLSEEKPVEMADESGCAALTSKALLTTALSSW